MVDIIHCYIIILLSKALFESVLKQKTPESLVSGFSEKPNHKKLQRLQMRQIIAVSSGQF